VVTDDEIEYVKALAESYAVLSAALPPQDRDDLHLYIQEHYGYTIPRVAVCDGHCSPFDALADAFFRVVLDAIWVGPRTGGKTVQFALLDHLMMKHFGTTIANIGAIEEQAKKCYKYITGFLALPEFRNDVRGESLISKTTLRNGGEVEIMPATMNRVNSPHPERAHWDEIELTSWTIIQEGLSMPVRTNGNPPATIYTSSRKKAYGPMEQLLEEASDLRRYFWCVWEIIENCPPERHQDGAPTGCGSCQLEATCRAKTTDVNGVEHYVPGPGRASRSHGWMPIDDVIHKYLRMDESVWNSQWLSLRPDTKGLAYPMFDEKLHVVDYDYNPAFPVVSGIDFGYTNPCVALYAQPTPSDDVIIFAEDYASGRTADVFARSIIAEPWFTNTAWRVADHDAGDAATLAALGVQTEPANKHALINNLPNVVGGISVVRWALKPMGRRRPILYIARRCVNTIREIKKYHHPDEKDDKNIDERPVKSDDHAMDAGRYLLVRLFRGMLDV
jgi:hypothetical protein